MTVGIKESRQYMKKEPTRNTGKLYEAHSEKKKKIEESEKDESNRRGNREGHRGHGLTQ